MELIYSLGVGVFCACGVWLLLRPRTFQVILGLALLSYATNLFIFAMGRVAGWIAHAREQAMSGRLIRPQSRYIGPLPKQAA